ncbi:Uu.00g030480.m01.CDS01 [Anthostomella pinea]|uniref:Uu.00g030480.m01.CDS01 n=1 Tax=Anthostomella pinea TaxID=933095 RepID=A0AAI8V8C0_9PEZI|nr:Uu.00g030480.m01.CDS01 [Anthostomella pinea]
MRASHVVLSFVGLAHGLPTFGAETRDLINLSPTVSPALGLDNSNSCLGLGISACDPINVGGTQNSNNGKETETQVGSQSSNKGKDSCSSKKTKSGSGSTTGSGSLINISPDVSPDVDINNENSCTGIGISVCDPINVDGTQGSNNS